MYVFVSFLVWQLYHIERGGGADCFAYFILAFICVSLFVCFLVSFFVPIGLSVICDCVMMLFICLNFCPFILIETLYLPTFLVA